MISAFRPGARLLAAAGALGAALITAEPALAAPPLVVRPFVQPGDEAAESSDTKTIVWVTEPRRADYRVEFAAGADPFRSAPVTQTPIRVAGQERYCLYNAALKGLPLDRDIRYRVLADGVPIAENAFASRRSAEQKIRFVVTGDLASGDAGKYAIAHQMVGQHPQFVLVCGDIAYERGRISDYQEKFWPVYDDDRPNAKGTAIMQSVPFFMALGNHDVEASDLTQLPDAFAAFYFFHAPRRVPAHGPWRPFIPGPEARVNDFLATAERAGYPYLCLYSFDNGPAHFLALDSNADMPLLSADYREWIRHDLRASHARWKFVYFHEPGFQAASNHSAQQRLRLLAPLFEEAGVDVAFAGHVHNYQRSKPLRFLPKKAFPEVGEPVRGQFTLDEDFDGAQRTTPRGVIYIVTGGGGAELYPMMPTHVPGAIMADPDAPTTFNAKSVDDRHSFSLVEADAHRLELHQIDERGAEVDHITITKP